MIGFKMHWHKDPGLNPGPGLGIIFQDITLLSKDPICNSIKQDEGCQ